MDLLQRIWRDADKEKFTAEQRPPLMFTGIHILEPRIFDYIPHGVFSFFVVDVYLKAMAKGESIAVHVANESWFELSTHPQVPGHQPALDVNRKGPRLVVTGVKIATIANVTEAIVWDEVTIDKGATVRHAVLADDVVISAGEVVENAAVVCADLVRGKASPPKALKGEFRGNNFVVPLGE